MQRDHTPAKSKPAETLFAFTEGEIARALAAFIQSVGETVPQGTRIVLLDEACGSGFVNLLVTHRAEL